MNMEEIIKAPSLVAFQKLKIDQQDAMIKKLRKENKLLEALRANLEDRLKKANKILRNDPNFNYREQ